ncbi:MAG: M42 family metallopeptidase [Anaerolineales bacterium]|nr:M42 family metallopeptidase [Anaerolineales bacterium]
MRNSDQLKDKTPLIGSAQIRLLQRLCDACAVSGDEGEVRKIILDQVTPHSDEVKIDALGNVLAIRNGRSGTSVAKGEKDRLRVMLAAHMDEVGFMITNNDGDGIFRFDVVGGIDERQLPGKPVWVGKDHIPGVIGTKPIHLTTSDERKRNISLDNLRIDIGPASTSEVKIGDRATFATSFSRLGSSLRGKALDDRLGVATLIELIKHAPTNIDMLAAFTVQEEVGLRGARVAAYGLDPDIAIAVDSTPALDLPNWDEEDGVPLENVRYNTRLDAGPAIYVADAATLSDPRLIRHLVNVAEANKIPYQIRQPGGGGTDAGAIHRSRAGIPSVSISVPGRYAHTAAGIARLADWKHTLNLLYLALNDISPTILSQER